VSDLQACIDAMLDVNWTPAAEALAESGQAFVRMMITSNGLVLELVGAEQRHCPTCQCNKLNPTPPVPGNPRSRSWHENADHAPPK